MAPLLLALIALPAADRSIDVGSAVLSLAVTEDGTTLATGCADRKVRLFDTTTWKVTATLSGHTERVWGLDFSKDGKRLVSGALDGTAKIWNVETGAVERTLVHMTTKPKGAKEKRVPAVAFSEDGKTVATGGNDARVVLWTAETGIQKRVLAGHKKGVHGVDFAKDGRIASSSWDGTIRVFSAGGASLRTIRSPVGAPKRVTWTKEETQRLVAPGFGKGAFVADADGTVLHTYKGYGGPCHAAAVSSDGRRVATGSKDQTVRIHTVDTDKPIETKKVKGDAWALTHIPGKNLLAVGTGSGQLVLIETPNYNSPP